MDSSSVNFQVFVRGQVVLSAGAISVTAGAVAPAVNMLSEALPPSPAPPSHMSSRRKVAGRERGDKRGSLLRFRTPDTGTDVPARPETGTRSETGHSTPFEAPVLDKPARISSSNGGTEERRNELNCNEGTNR